MKTKQLMFVLVMLILGGVNPASAAFKDIKIDLTGQWLLTEDEFSNKSAVEFGVVVADDGTTSRVEATDATANAVIKGVYYNDHGWGGATLTVPVDGMVKIGVGNCYYAGHTVKVTDASGAEVLSFATEKSDCWKNAKTDEYVTFGYYKGSATTLTITTTSYTPYISVETATEVPSEASVSYSLGGVDAVGVLPEGITSDIGSAYTIPLNRTLYVDGKTLKAWTDGTDNYAPGQEITLEKNLELTPVFTDNTVSLADRTESVTVNFDFQRKNGAPTVGYQNVTGIWVTQAVVNGQPIDVKLDFDTNNGGKIANANWTDWCQMNNGTKLTVPSCKGAVVSVEAYNVLGVGNSSVLTIDGQSDYTSGKIVSYTVAGTAENIDVVIGAEGSYYRYVQVVLPVVEPSFVGKTFTDENGDITWAVGNESDANIASNITGAVSSASVSTGSGLKVETATYFDEQMVKYTPLTSNAGSVEGVMIEYRVKPAKGLTFKPTNVSYDAVKVGSAGATFSTSYTVNGEESAIKEIDASTVRRDDGSNSETTELRHNNEINTEGAEVFTFRFYISKTANNKNIAIGNVVISGIFNGTVEEATCYNLAVAASPAEGGNITVYPNINEYEEGTEVQLTATQNFGYHFVNWTDAAGNEVSTEAKFTYTVDADAELTANFEAVKTYELTYNVEGGANLYMVQPTPAPTVVDGKNMYEEGTEVTLTASNNPILAFTNWSTGETASETKVIMDGNKSVTATYSALDYIVGWDFYNSGNNGRPADFASTADNESAVLVLRNDAGNTVGWLDKSTVADGGYESLAGAAVNWQAVGEYYYQTKINARDFQNIRVQANMMYNYMAYTTQVLEYSLNGSEWTEVTRVTMPGRKVVTPIAGTLPEEANHAEELYLRWRPDLAEKDGSTSDKDGTVIADIYILADAEVYNDGIAPVLKSSVPEDNATGASASGKVVLNFDEKVKLTGNAKATLNGEELELVVTGMTVTAAYKNLEYATDYVFSLAGNSVSDLAGNTMTDAVTINFTTMDRPVVAKGIFNKVVSNVEELLAAITEGNAYTTGRYRIFVKDGTYDLGDKVLTSISGNISLVGESMENTIIVNTTPAGKDDKGNDVEHIEGIGSTATFLLNGENIYMQDLTVKNAYPYGTGGFAGRAVAIQDKGTKNVFKYVKMLSYQDTYYTNNNSQRSYLEDCEIHGVVDFICGGGDIFFNRNLIYLENRTGNVITAPAGNSAWGYVFSDCTIDGADANAGTYFLGRPWQQEPRCVWLNTTMKKIPAAAGWTNMGPLPKLFAEYNSHTESGTLVDCSQRRKAYDTKVDNVETKDAPYEGPTVLTDAQAAEYTIDNVLGGNDNWQPTLLTEQASAPANVLIDGSSLTWDNSDYVLCWAVCKDGKVVDFTTEPGYAVDDATATWSVRAANEMGGLGEATVATAATAINEVGAEAGDVVSTAFYNLQGIRVDGNYTGVVIKVDTMKDGSQVSTKIVK